MRRKAAARWLLISLCVFSLLSFCVASTTAKPAIVLITLDSTRADRMGFLGSKLALTPNLDRLASDSLIFEHAYAQAPGIVVSHASILTGAYPQATGMSEIGGTLPSALPYLPDLLKAQGYRTAAFVSSTSLDAHNGLAQGYDRGFETYDSGDRLHAKEVGSSPSEGASRGKQVADRAIEWLAQNKQQQFFLWIQISDPIAGNNSGAAYNSTIKMMDAAVGQLVSALQQRKLYDGVAIVVAAAEGESLGAHGEDAHGIFLYDETIHVPLLLKLPQGRAGAKPTSSRVSAKARLVDIAPSLLEVAGIPVPSQLQGQSLLRVAKSNSDQPAYSRADLPQRGFGLSQLESWRAGKYIYIRAPQPELYDLSADPGATRNLAQTSKATLDTLAAQLDQFDRHFTGEAGKGATELSSSEMQKLASLGYVGLQKASSSSTAVTGIDPKEKDRIAVANKVIAISSAAGLIKPNRAIATLQPIVSTDPGIFLAQYSLGVELARKGDYAEAVKHLHKAIELQPESAWAHFEMGASLLKTGDYKTAIVHLEIATGRLPNFSPAHLDLAEAYDHAGRAEDAKRERGKLGQK
jgi:choline-sulfatase